MMYGPNRKGYPNEVVVNEADLTNNLVIHHVSSPRHVLTVILEPSDGDTLVKREQSSQLLRPDPVWSTS